MTKDQNGRVLQLVTSFIIRRMSTGAIVSPPTEMRFASMSRKFCSSLNPRFFNVKVLYCGVHELIDTISTIEYWRLFYGSLLSSFAQFAGSKDGDSLCRTIPLYCSKSCRDSLPRLFRLFLQSLRIRFMRSTALSFGVPEPISMASSSASL